MSILSPNMCLSISVLSPNMCLPVSILSLNICLPVSVLSLNICRPVSVISVQLFMSVWSHTYVGSTLWNCFFTMGCNYVLHVNLPSVDLISAWLSVVRYSLPLCELDAGSMTVTIISNKNWDSNLESCCSTCATYREIVIFSVVAVIIVRVSRASATFPLLRGKTII